MGHVRYSLTKLTAAQAKEWRTTVCYVAISLGSSSVAAYILLRIVPTDRLLFSAGEPLQLTSSPCAVVSDEMGYHPQTSLACGSLQNNLQHMCKRHSQAVSKNKIRLPLLHAIQQTRYPPASLKDVTMDIHHDAKYRPFCVGIAY